MIVWLLGCNPCLEEQACGVALGEYHIVPPKGKINSVWMFFHGWSGSPQQYIGVSSIEEVVAQEGVLLILPKGKSETWSMEHMGGEDSYRDDAAFVQNIFADIDRKYDLEGIPKYLSGFSLGAALAEQLACSTDLNLSGISPISGGFWEPVPVRCSHEGLSVRHVHGLQDATWPWEGRWVGSGRQAAQEDIQSLWTNTYSCQGPGEVYQDGPLSCTSWQGCQETVSWCTHTDGHKRLSGWFERMVRSMQ